MNDTDREPVSKGRTVSVQFSMYCEVQFTSLWMMSRKSNDFRAACGKGYLQPTESVKVRPKSSAAVLVNDNLAKLHPDREVGRLRASLPGRWVSMSTGCSQTK